VFLQEILGFGAFWVWAEWPLCISFPRIRGLWKKPNAAFIEARASKSLEKRRKPKEAPFLIKGHLSALAVGWGGRILPPNPGTLFSKSNYD
jgi:hypothetical protein